MTQRKSEVSGFMNILSSDHDLTERDAVRNAKFVEMKKFWKEMVAHELN